MPTLQARTARHLALATLACSLAPTAAHAAVQYQVVRIPVPANIDGAYINVETLQVGSAGAVVAGWDLNPYSASSLTWFNATGTGMMRYPGVTTGSAGSLDTGAVVDQTRSFGSGIVTVGTSPGNWRLNSLNYFGFRFVAADGLTHYGWGSFWIGSAINGADRFIAELAWETTPGVGIAVGDKGAPANDDRHAATVLDLGGSLIQSGVLGATASPDSLPSASDCIRLNWCTPLPDVWFRINPPGQPGLLGISLCGTSYESAVIVYRLDEASGALEEVAMDGGSVYCGAPDSYNSARLNALFVGRDVRPILMRVPAFDYGTIALATTWTPIQEPAYSGGKLWYGGATFADGGVSSDNGFFEIGLMGADGSGGTGSGLAGSYGYLMARTAATSTGGRAITLVGFVEGSQPADYFADSNFRFTSHATDGSNTFDPIEIALPQDYYYRITGAGHSPTLTARSGCFCNGKMSEGTYRIDLGSFGVVLGSEQTYVASAMNWTLELQPTPFTAPADINADGRVDANDLALMLGSWGATGGPADIDRDGIVGGSDLSVLLGGWTG